MADSAGKVNSLLAEGWEWEETCQFKNLAEQLRIENSQSVMVFVTVFVMILVMVLFCFELCAFIFRMFKLSST